jgi:hypothetical protein
MTTRTPVAARVLAVAAPSPAEEAVTRATERVDNKGGILMKNETNTRIEKDV